MFKIRHLTLLFLVVISLGCTDNNDSKKFSDTISSATKSSNSSSKIIIEGSETELHLVQSLIHQFKDLNKDQQIVITGGGSKISWDDLLSGKIDIANSSEKIDTKYFSKVKEQGDELKEVIIAMDAVSIITNEKLGVDSLSNFELGKIFRGEITNWKDVGGHDLPITVYNRDMNSGTYSFIWKKLIQDEFVEYGEIVKDNDELLQKIKGDSTGIGYIGLGYITDENGKPVENVWSVNIYIEGDNAYTPYEVSQVLEGHYYLTRPLYQYFLKSKSEKVMPFIQFELSEEGQFIVFKNRFLPISEEYRIKNEQNGIK